MVQITPWQLFLMGGPLMWPILACSLISLTVIIQRFSYLSAVANDMRSLEEKVFSKVRGNMIREALDVCDKSLSPAGPVLKAGLLKFSCAKDDIVEAMQDAVRLEMPALERGMAVLSTTIKVAPLLGILGTLLGLSQMIHSAHIRAEALNPLSSADMMNGLWQALVTTASGLTVMIIAAIAYNCFAIQILQIVHVMERSSAVLLEMMTASSAELREEGM